MPDLDVLLELPKAGIFPHAKDDNAILPIVFGNYLDPLAIPADDANGGFTPAVLIDTLTLTYIVNGTRAVTTDPQRYMNNKPQSPATATWNPNVNFGGYIAATLTFTLSDVIQKQISVKFGGTADATGQPITNPIFALYFMLTTFAGWTLNDFDRGVCLQTAQDMTALGYEPFYFCFQEEKTIREWLLEICPMFHTDFTENGQGQLAIMLDRSLTTFTVFPDFHITADMIEDQGEPITAIGMEAHADDVANQVTLHGRYNWAVGVIPEEGGTTDQNKTTASYTWDDVASQNAYNAAYPAEFTFRGMYTLQHATQWLSSFSFRHAYDPMTVSFTMKGLRGIPLITPRFITLGWPLFGWTQHLLKIRKTTISFRRRAIDLECVDCQRELADTPTSPNASPSIRRRQLSRVFEWVPGAVGAGGEMLDAPDNPRNEAANGDFSQADNGQWDFYAGNGSRQWQMIENDTESYQGRYYVRHVPLSGNGTSTTLRHRLDPGQYFFVSAWFRQHTSTNGRAIAAAFFYDRNDAYLGVAAGNYVVPTTTWLESVAFGATPANTYYYRPGIGFAVYPTSGIWRADHVFAVSGSLNQVLTARQGDLTSRNFIINGDFELGSCMYVLGGTWIITNDPGAPARSGIWKAAHQPTSGSTEERLNSMTKISVTPGQVFTLQAYVITLNNPNGFGRLGVTWLDAQGNLVSENATTGTGGPIAAYTLASGTMTVPAGATYAHVWAGVSNHSLPGTFWVVDDVFLSIA